MNKNKLLIIHGHNSNGYWMKLLKQKFKDYSIDIDYFNYGKVVFGITTKHINNYSNKFNDWYHLQNSQLNNKEDNYPSIIAHSLGSYILLKTMEKDASVKFNKIYLFGSIIPSSYNFNSLISKNQFFKIINYKIGFDIIAMLSFIITGKLYTSGVYGFKKKQMNIVEIDSPNGTHNDVKKFSIVRNIISEN
jgi:predicted alpha/beta hydrolase family esterase